MNPAADSLTLLADARISPYPGLRSFSPDDHAIFFGRDDDRVVIAANLAAARRTVLYGPSGVGKSSLLRAGVLVDLETEARAAIRDEYARPRVAVVVRDWSSDPASRINEQLTKTATALELAVEGTTSSATGTLPDLVGWWCDRLDCDIVLMLDQFEEFFLYHRSTDGFGSDLIAAMNRRDLPVSFLLSIRESSLGDLDLLSEVRGGWENRIRLAHLTHDAAARAIRGPLEVINHDLPAVSSPFRVEDELVNQVVSSGEVIDTRTGYSGVAAPILSLVMQRIWGMEREADSRLLRASTLEDAGGAENIARTHVDDALSAVQTADRELAAATLERLLTPSGTKIALNARDIAAMTGQREREVRRVLQTLASSDVRILRPKPVSGPLRQISSMVGQSAGESKDDESSLLAYELFHDLLAPGVINWTSQQRADLDASRAAERQQLKEARRWDIVSFVLGLALLLGALVGVALATTADILQVDLELFVPMAALVLALVASFQWVRDPRDRPSRRLAMGALVGAIVAGGLAIANGQLFAQEAQPRGFLAPAPVEVDVVADSLTSEIDTSPEGSRAARIVLPFTVTNRQDVVQLRITQGASYGSAVIDGEAAVYTPSDSFAGTDTFVYEVCATGRCDEGLITVDVRPYALDDTVRARAGEATIVHVLENDLSTSLEVRLVSKAEAGGTVTVGSNGTIRYEPPPDFSSDSFGYQACAEGSAGDLCAHATVTLLRTEGDALTMPNVVGERNGEALLESLGLQVVRVTQRTGCSPEGEIIAQRPPAEDRVQAGDTVTITVSKPISGNPDCLAAAYDDLVLGSAPIAYWPLALTGNVRMDEVIGGGQLTPLDGRDQAFIARSVEGPGGIGAIAFDASAGERLQSAFSPNTALGDGAWTLEMWVLIDALPMADRLPITVVGGWDDLDDRRWYVNVRNGGRVCVGIGARGSICTRSGVVTENTWHHVAFTFDPATREAGLVVDAALAPLESNPWSSTELLTSDDIAIGAIYATTAGEFQEHWDGALSRVAIYDRVLGIDEIVEHFSSVRLIPPTVDEGPVEPPQEGSQPPPPQTTGSIVVELSGAGVGNVTSTPSGIDCGEVCTGQFATGTSVTLTAEANPGSMFVGWSGACAGISECSLNVPSAGLGVVATFGSIADHTMAVEVVNGSGTVVSDPAGIDCGGVCETDFAEGTLVSLTAFADEGFAFQEWTGACSGAGPCTVQIASDVSVGAMFTPIATYELTVQVVGVGSGMVVSALGAIDCGDICAAAFSEGTTVTLTAVADDGSEFVGWSGGCSGLGACTIAMTQSYDITARFRLDPALP